MIRSYFIGALAALLLASTQVMSFAQKTPNGSIAQTSTGMLDLTHATIVLKSASKVENKAALMLAEEVAKRSFVVWSQRSTSPAGSSPIILIGTKADLKGAIPAWPDAALTHVDGYVLRIVYSGSRTIVVIAGGDPRGVLFGVGRLLRNLMISRDAVLLPSSTNITTYPYHPLRGHQLGYRPKTNSYDGWTIQMWEQYVRDLAVFGANAVELIPPRSDDEGDSPLFPEPPLRMMEKMSALLDSYGMDVWVWYPALEADYSKPQQVAAAVQEWSEVFRRLSRIDAVFVPGGDPGHTRPDVLMNLLQKQAESLHKYHPRAKIWVSPQGFDQMWVDQFLTIVKTQKPSWLGGVVFGPQVRTPLSELRKLVPAQYPIRHYPDITHSTLCQFPVEDWDLAFALTEGRECINPRPAAETTICRAHQADTIGSITYSEGCNDDVNKAIWSAMEWDPSTDTKQVLREYSRYFIDTRFEETFANGLMALEKDWVGSAESNTQIPKTLKLFQDIEKASTPANRANWRYQQALYRAYYDAYVQARAAWERTSERSAMFALSRARSTGWIQSLSTAEAFLTLQPAPAAAADLSVRLKVLAEALFQSIRMQLSVPLYGALNVERGANLDQIDNTINDKGWLLDQIKAIRSMPDDTEKLKRIDEIVHWTDAGEGGFYDDLGDPRHRPHLDNSITFPQDPGRLKSVRMGWAVNAKGRMRWRRFAETLWDTPLQMRYFALDPKAHYKLRVTYGPEKADVPIRLTASGGVEIQPMSSKPVPNHPVEFDLPAAAFATGDLTLTFSIQAGFGRNGRGCQVCEVWLIKSP